MLQNTKCTWEYIFGLNEYASKFMWHLKSSHSSADKDPSHVKCVTLCIHHQGLRPQVSCWSDTPWRWRKYAPLKCQELFTSWYSATTQKTLILKVNLQQPVSQLCYKQCRFTSFVSCQRHNADNFMQNAPHFQSNDVYGNSINCYSSVTNYE